MNAPVPSSAAVGIEPPEHARVLTFHVDAERMLLRAVVEIDNEEHRLLARWGAGRFTWDCSCGDAKCPTVAAALDAAKAESAAPPAPVADSARSPATADSTTPARLYYRLATVEGGLELELRVGVAPARQLPRLALHRALAEPPPRFVTPEDQRLLGLLAGNTTITDLAVLEAIAKTGRAFHEDLGGQPLRWGGDQPAGTHWRWNADGTQHLDVVVPAAALRILDDPPVVLQDVDLVHLRHDLDGATWQALHAGLAIDSIAARWPVAGHGNTPKPLLPVAIEDRTDPPIAVLRLDRRDGINFAELLFAYGELEIAPATETDPIIAPAGDRATRHARDWAAEASRLGWLRRSRWEGGPARWTLPGSAAALARFVLEEQPELEAAGWRVERGGGFPDIRLLGSGDLAVELEPDGARLTDTAGKLDLVGIGGDPVRAGDQVLVETRSGGVVGVADTLFRDVQLALGGGGKPRRAQLAALPIETRAPYHEAHELPRLGNPGEPRLEGDLAEVLRPYQRTGVAWLQSLAAAGFGGVLADDMGLGKTLQTIAFLASARAEAPEDPPALVVAPLSLLENWRAELERFAPELDVVVHHGPDRELARWADNDVVLTTYGLVRTEDKQFAAAAWQAVVLDEAQTIKNPRSRTARAVRTVEAPFRVALSGTPMENHLGELWSLLAFAEPGALGAEAAFEQTFRKPIEAGDEHRRAALIRRLRPFMLRRTREQVLGELPPLIESERRIELDDQQRALYESLRSTAVTDLEALEDADDFTRRARVLQIITRLRQACCAPALLPEGFPLRDAPAAKLTVLDEMLDELIAEQRSVLVFSQFTGLLDLVRDRLAERGLEPLLLTGSTRDRAGVVERFQNGESPVFLVSLKAGGAGLNLTRADTVILLDPWWNPAVEQQAAARAHRMGQQNTVFVYRLIAADTIEEDMQLMKLGKRRLNDALSAAIERLDLGDAAFLDEVSGA
ncbi:MAG: DEAD/DEAH box helicase [Pseudomonadota bacterium]